MQLEANVSLEIVRVIQAILILLVTADAIVNFLQIRRKRSTDVSDAPTVTDGEQAPSVTL